MFRYIKELIHPFSKKYISSKEPIQSLTVSFKKNEKSLIYQGEVEGRSFAKDDATEGKSHMQRCNERLNEATTVLVEKMLAPYIDLVPGITNPDHLKNLTDLRTGEWTQKLQNFTINDSQPRPKCEEIPRDFFEEPSSDNVTIQSSFTNLAEPTLKKLGKHKENELDMKRMLCNLQNQKDLRKAKKILESSPSNTVDQILSETTTASKKSEKQHLEMNKILNNMLKARELAIKGPEQNKVQENKTGIINIDNILEYEEKMRGGKNIVCEETMKLLNWKSKDPLTSNPQEQNYIRDLIEINRVLECKMMRSKERRTEVIDKSHNLKEPRLNPKVETNVNPIEIKNIQVLKIKPDNNKEHIIGTGITGYDAIENVKKQK